VVYAAGPFFWVAIAWQQCKAFNPVQSGSIPAPPISTKNNPKKFPQGIARLLPIAIIQGCG